MNARRLTDAVFALFPEPIAIVGDALAVREVNDAWRQAFGEGAGPLGDRALGEAIERVIAGAPRAEGTAHVEGARHRASVVAIPDGEARAAMVHLRASPAAGAAGELTDEEVRDQRELLRQVLDTDPNLLFVKDAGGNFLLVNRAFSELFNKAPEDIVGRHETDLHPKKKATTDSFLRIDQEVIRTMNEIAIEEQVPLPTGEMRWFLTRKRPFVRANGEVHVLGSSADITERRQSAMALEEAAVELERRAAEAWRQAEAKAALVQELDQKLAIIEAQHQEILTLSAPLIDVGEDILAVPIVGAMSEARAEEIMARLLGAIADRQVRRVILDMTGLETLEAQTAELLVRIARAIELLGARALITGIRPAVARMIVQLGIDLSGMATMQTLRAALASLERRRRA
ncbi:STAS domain-containing protein [Polyangium aurulentum]|uniref:STAS domain-containing protein n=1 Tax=Polyangium aurulentum TaxID=2567896 RepID=UPI0010AEAE5E|nr:STAS domain-containing protein [Polyangium aurulentum]UQA59228.1 PAS domain-containing protein [Polyangium aurulentum]